MSLERGLRKYGYDVCGVVASGEDALETVLHEKPDVVLMDILLSGRIDGFEAAEAIRASVNIPIIFMTGYADDEIASMAKRAGCAGFMVKPVEPGELAWAISLALQPREDDEIQSRKSPTAGLETGGWRTN